MKRVLPFLILILAGPFAANANPARPLYAPSAAPSMPAQVSVNLNGTAWLGKYVAANRIYIFEADGTLSYRTPTAKAAKVYKNRGAWKLEGNKLYFEFYTVPANKLMEFRGVITDANTIAGEASYLFNGTKAPQTLQRARRIRNDM